MSNLCFSANLSTLFREVPFLSRFEAAREAGFDHVEFRQPYDWPIDLLVRRLHREDLTATLIDTPLGTDDGLAQGLACVPGQEEAFRVSIELALSYATALHVPMINCLSGLVPPGAKRSDIRTLYLDNVAYAARRAEECGVRVLIQPLNEHDTPGAFLDNFATASRYLESIRARSAEVKILFDFHECVRLHGECTPWLAALAHDIGYYKLAGLPGRHEPDHGTLPYTPLLREASHLTPGLCVGLDYTALGPTEAGLGWLAHLDEGVVQA